MKKFYVVLNKESKLIDIFTNKKAQEKALRASGSLVGFTTLAYNEREVRNFYAGYKVGGRSCLVIA